MSSPRSIWWLVSGTVVLAAFATTSVPLAGATFAGLQLIGGSQSKWHRAAALVIGLLALGALVAPRESPSGAVIAVFQLFAAVAFVVMAWSAPGPFLPRATAALAWSGASAVVLAWMLNGADTWGLLAWDTLRETSFALRSTFEVMSIDSAVGTLADMYGKFEPLVRFFSTARPALAILSGYGALAVGWQWHIRAAEKPLGPALRPFREFRLADGAVWGVIAAAIAWILSGDVPGLRVAALNIGLILGALYVLRGAAVVGAAAAIVAVPAWVQALAVFSGVLFAPATAPSLCVLGVSDTWLEFRRRLESRPN
ncbi:MAG TPA: DUF2232 domain-containing protein [Gemmatimonadales bacterium]|nr:DUF2232 domain-containing protein [Gemmatimonadales bacterium]